MSSVLNTFKQLGLPSFILSALADIGYEIPSPIQMQSIPAMLEGRDIIAQAQTGTGKTAAFALPALTNIDIKIAKPQVLVIAPTRELAIQVAEAFQSYAKHLPGFHVLPIYGGQQYESQLRALKRGVHVVVGTPGRIMDHMRRKTLNLDALKTIVLDEADEMLKMGFIDDVQWILQQIPSEHQTALFSATMPTSIQKIAHTYLIDPVKIHIEPAKKTAAAIQQNYILVNRENKLEVLTRFLEVEEFEAAIIFVRTKVETVELAEKLEARGYAVAALNGDIPQALREKVVSRVKNGTLDIIVATEVAARGLDVERMSFVINYDIPSDPESYVHRVGRTGRAGRQGKALLFVTPREQHALRSIERTLGHPIQKVDPPSVEKVSRKRTQQLMEKIYAAVGHEHSDDYYDLVDQMKSQYNCSVREIAAALVCLWQKGKPLTIAELKSEKERRDTGNGKRHARGKESFERSERHGAKKNNGNFKHRKDDFKNSPDRKKKQDREERGAPKKGKQRKR